jgi:hypothetical protein
MTRIARFPYEQTPAGVPMPYIPVQLETSSVAIQVKALVDTRAMVNVFPNQVGKALKLNWDEGEPIDLGGNLGKAQARAFTISCTIPGLNPVEMEFNWSLLERIPVILGQLDFFEQFDVCISYSENEISIRPRRGTA